MYWDSSSSTSESSHSHSTHSTYGDTENGTENAETESSGVSAHPSDTSFGVESLASINTESGDADVHINADDARFVLAARQFFDAEFEFVGICKRRPRLMRRLGYGISTPKKWLQPWREFRRRHPVASVDFSPLPKLESQISALTAHFQQLAGTNC